MTAVHPDASQQAVVEAALVLLKRMGLTPADLTAVPQHRKPVPTFAGYIPVVSAAVSAGTRRAYGSYWNRVVEHWGDRRLDEPTPSEIRQLMSYVKTHVVARRNARGGRSAAEHLVAALRCLYKHAEDHGLITPGENPARKVDKPRRLPSTPPGRHRRPARRDLPGRPQTAATIQSWIRCCCGCTPRPPADVAGRSRCQCRVVSAARWPSTRSGYIRATGRGLCR
jgi:hypothetical protein